MKEVKIDKTIEQTVEAIFLNASALNEYYKTYPNAVRSALGQFQLGETYRDSKFIPDDVENLKLRMYAFAVKDLKEYQEREKIKKEEAIKKYK